MNDTHPAMAKRVRVLMKQKSGRERLMIGFSMYETARKIVMASIRSKNPDASPSTMRRALFIRFYGDDLEPVLRNKILHLL